MNKLQKIGRLIRKVEDDVNNGDAEPQEGRELLVYYNEVIQNCIDMRVQILTSFLCDDVVANGALKNYDDCKMLARVSHTIATELELLISKDLENL